MGLLKRSMENFSIKGMVSMCASCNDLYPWAALVIGIVAGLAYISWHHLVLLVKIDDPLDAVAGEVPLLGSVKTPLL